MPATAEERRSAAGVPFGWGVTPNASPDAEWRQQVAGGYSGILAGAAVIEHTAACLHVAAGVVTQVDLAIRALYSVAVTSETC